MKVLVVEDDRGIARTVCDALALNGYHPRWCRRGGEALATYSTTDLVLLDVTLRDVDGLEVLRRLRRDSIVVPVLVLAAHTDESSVVAALRSGADDYVTKPLRLRELLARVEALARRAVIERTALARVVQVEHVAVDLRARMVRVGEPVKLTDKQFDVLAVLARRVGTAVSRQQIMEEVWGQVDHGLSRSLDVHITALRAKLACPKLLQTVRGFGYRLG